MPDAAEPACKEAPGRMGLGIAPGAAAENGVAVRNIKGAGGKSNLREAFSKKTAPAGGFPSGPGFLEYGPELFCQ